MRLLMSSGVAVVFVIVIMVGQAKYTYASTEQNALMVTEATQRTTSIQEGHQDTLSQSTTPSGSVMAQGALSATSSQSSSSQDAAGIDPDDLPGMIATLSGELEDLRSDLDAEEQRNMELVDRAMRYSVAQRHIDHLTEERAREEASIAEQVSSLEQEIAQNGVHIAFAREELAYVEEQLLLAHLVGTPRYGELLERQTTLTSRIERYEMRIEMAEAQIENLRTRIREIDEEITLQRSEQANALGEYGSIDELMQALHDSDDRIADLERRIEEAQDMLTQLQMLAAMVLANSGRLY